jgi:hypothetical protein
MIKRLFLWGSLFCGCWLREPQPTERDSVKRESLSQKTNRPKDPQPTERVPANREGLSQKKEPLSTD